jgi:hypothetical protein
MLSATGWNDLLKVASPKSMIVWLVHPEKISASTRAGDLAAMGYRVISGPWNSSGIVRAKANIPAAVVVDLSRSPSAGRDIAIAMRSHSALLTVPFVLVGGSPEAVAAIRRFLPDAIESSWHEIVAALPAAMKKVVTGAPLLSVFAAYKGTPLWKKLGIRAGAVVSVNNAPREFRSALGELPKNVTISPRREGPRDLTLWFVRSRRELTREITRMKQHAGSGRLWILWEKAAKAAGGGGLSQKVVRQAGLHSGLVDFKIARVDESWAGLRFTVRR